MPRHGYEKKGLMACGLQTVCRATGLTRTKARWAVDYQSAVYRSFLPEYAQ